MKENFLSILIILSNLLLINSQDSTTPSNNTGPTPQQIAQIMAMNKTCVPTPIGINYLSKFQPDCKKLNKYPIEDFELRCCELEFQEKENSSAPLRRGCMAFLANYIDNDIYEDMIDNIKRGKQDKMQTYSVFLGKTAYDQFVGFLKNNTKYNVYKFDCSFQYILTKFCMVFLLTALML